MVGDEETHIYYRKSARTVEGVGFLDLDDRDGFGPEVFTGDTGITGGTFRIRVNFFSGHADSVSGRVRIILYKGEGLVDNVYSFTVNKRDWADIGEFEM